MGNYETRYASGTTGTTGTVTLVSAPTGLSTARRNPSYWVKTLIVSVDSTAANSSWHLTGNSNTIFPTQYMTGPDSWKEELNLKNGDGEALRIVVDSLGVGGSLSYYVEYEMRG